MFQTKVAEKIKIHILCSVNFFFFKSYPLWDNVGKYGADRETTDDNIKRPMRFACWITKATKTHSEYVILIAFPQQKWLHQCASMLRLYLLCLSYCLEAIKVSFSPHQVEFHFGIPVHSKLQMAYSFLG